MQWSAIPDLLSEKLFEHFLLICILRHLISTVRGHDDDAIGVTNDDVTGVDRSITAADGYILFDNTKVVAADISGGTDTETRQPRLSNTIRIA